MRCRASVRLFQIIDNSIHFLPQAECKIIVGDNYLLQDSAQPHLPEQMGGKKAESVIAARCVGLRSGQLKANASQEQQTSVTSECSNY